MEGVWPPTSFIQGKPKTQGEAATDKEKAARWSGPGLRATSLHRSPPTVAMVAGAASANRSGSFGSHDAVETNASLILVLGFSHKNRAFFLLRMQRLGGTELTLRTDTVVGLSGGRPLPWAQSYPVGRGPHHALQPHPTPTSFLWLPGPWRPASVFPLCTGEETVRGAACIEAHAMGFPTREAGTPILSVPTEDAEAPRSE